MFENWKPAEQRERNIKSHIFLLKTKTVMIHTSIYHRWLLLTYINVVRMYKYKIKQIFRTWAFLLTERRLRVNWVSVYESQRKMKERPKGMGIYMHIYAKFLSFKPERCCRPRNLRDWKEEEAFGNELFLWRFEK